MTVESLLVLAAVFQSKRFINAWNVDHRTNQGYRPFIA